MIRRDSIELYAGSSQGLLACQQAASVLALVAILSAPAEPLWMITTLLALGAVHCTCNRITRDHARLTLHANGQAVMHLVDGAVPARLCGEGWISRWCCVMMLEELLSGRRFPCLIFRSRNSPDDYRRLLVSLRMGQANTRTAGR